jgi:diguanylate cyclase (GGDEF)-like protein
LEYRFDKKAGASVIDAINVDKDLFKDERAALQAALADLADERYYGNQLLPRYKLLAVNYHKLLRITQKIFHISDWQAKSLQQHQNEIQNLLDNANQGFLTFGRDLKVDQQYSGECVKIFGGKIAGMPIGELLGQGKDVHFEAIAEKLRQVFSLPENEGENILHQLSSVVRIVDKDIQIEYKRISPSDNAVESSLIMMVSTDITEKMRADAQIRYLSFHDKLTTLYNRAYVEMVLPDLGKAGKLPLSIMMIDLNGLKLVNDVFGHEQGDQLLIAMAKVLTQSCRETDVVFRWGGDEFLILLPNTDHSECVKVCERIRLACAEEAGRSIPLLSAAIGTATQNEEVVHLSELFSVAEHRMYNDKLVESRKVRQNIITNMEGMLHDRCFENIGHSERIQRLAVDFAIDLGLNSDAPEMKLLSQLAILHDIGKVAIPKEILGKTGPLRPSDWEIIRSHSDIGYRMAQSIGELALADIILALHERWDGGGYPCKLQGDQIPFLARLFSIVDVYDVVTHDRPYNTAMDEDCALQEIAFAGGSQFDPEFADRFVEFMRRESRK